MRTDSRRWVRALVTLPPERVEGTRSTSSAATRKVTALSSSTPRAPKTVTSTPPPAYPMRMVTCAVVANMTSASEYLSLAIIGIAAWYAAPDGTSPNAATNASATMAAGGIGTSASATKIGSRTRSETTSTVRWGSRSAYVASS